MPIQVTKPSGSKPATAKIPARPGSVRGPANNGKGYQPDHYHVRLPKNRGMNTCDRLSSVRPAYVLPGMADELQEVILTILLQNVLTGIQQDVLIALVHMEFPAEEKEIVGVLAELSRDCWPIVVREQTATDHEAWVS
jgi:hypothetical protein